MLISFCIPTYNRASYLYRSIQSILVYQGNEIEVIVQDNNSPDNTSEVVKNIKDPRIRYFRNDKNIGGAPNTMKIIENATGEYIYYLTDDDFLFPDSIQRIVTFIEKYNPDCFSSDIITYLEKSNTVFNNSVNLNSGVIKADDVVGKARVFLSSHIISRLCFKKNKLPDLSKVTDNLYPQMYMMGYMIDKGLAGYLTGPIGIHTWENETFWGISPLDEKLINHELRILKALEGEVSPNLLIEYVTEFCRENGIIYDELMRFLTKDIIKSLKREIGWIRKKKMIQQFVIKIKQIRR